MNGPDKKSSYKLFGDFRLEIKYVKDHQWHPVSNVDFRWWKSHPSNGINGTICILVGVKRILIEEFHIEDVRVIRLGF